MNAVGFPFLDSGDEETVPKRVLGTDLLRWPGVVLGLKSLQ
jgi:hypothetical protein